MTGANWYALHVRSQCERRVRDGLVQRSIETYLPIYSERTRWSDRAKDAERVLFPGYLFGRFDLELRRKVVEITGVVRILGIGLDPAVIPEAEIEQVRRVVDSGVSVIPVHYLVAGQKVRVERGALEGVEGIVVRIRNSLRVVVSVELLGRSVAAELDADALLPVAVRRAA